jgi:hypothetical protein
MPVGDIGLVFLADYDIRLPVDPNLKKLSALTLVNGSANIDLRDLCTNPRNSLVMAAEIKWSEDDAASSLTGTRRTEQEGSMVADRIPYCYHLVGRNKNADPHTLKLSHNLQHGYFSHATHIKSKEYDADTMVDDVVKLICSFAEDFYAKLCIARSQIDNVTIANACRGTEDVAAVVGALGVPVKQEGEEEEEGPIANGEALIPAYRSGHRSFTLVTVTSRTALLDMRTVTEHKDTYLPRLNGVRMISTTRANSIVEKFPTERDFIMHMSQCSEEEGVKAIAQILPLGQSHRIGPAAGKRLYDIFYAEPYKIWKSVFNEKQDDDSSSSSSSSSDDDDDEPILRKRAKPSLPNKKNKK